MSQVHQHHHDHAEAEDPYYLDQMCLIALSALFGVVCLSLYFWRVDILKVMLSSQFHPFVLISGVILVILAVLRGISLWIQVGKQPVHADDHVHQPAAALASLPVLGAATPVAKEACDDHGHAHCGHDHNHDGHSHAHADHDHSHAHADHGHGHAHAHSHDGHDHSWAPWRYVLLLVPVILFFLGIPSNPPKVRASTPDVEVDYTREAMRAASWVGLEMPLLQASNLTATAGKRRTGDAQTLDFRTLEDSASKQEYREYWAGKAIKVKGQFVPNGNPNNSRVFSLGRFSINCCRQDAVQLNVPIVSSEDITHIKRDEWIQVIGEIQYRKDATGAYKTQLMVHGKEDVVKTTADPDPYIAAK